MAYAAAYRRDPTNVMGRRIAAFIIDILAPAVVVFVAFAFSKHQSYTNAPTAACQQLRDAGFSGDCIQLGSHVYTWSSGTRLRAFGLGALTGFLNNVVLQGLTGASIGKFVLGLRVVNAQGQVCGIGRAFARWLLLFVDMLCAGIVGLVTSLATHPHKRVGDMAAGTFVVGHADMGTDAVPQLLAMSAPAYMPPPGAPGWGSPPPGAQGWGAPPPQAPPPWGAPPPPPPGQQPPAWGAPPPPAWGAPPAPAPPVSGTPAPAPAPPPPAPEPPPAPAPAPPAEAEAPAPPPPPAPAAPAEAEAPAPPRPPAAGESQAAPSPGESWWNKAVEDDEPKQ